MNASDFVNSIREAAPSSSELVGLGLSTAEAAEIREHYFATEKDAGSAPSEITDHDLRELILRYDLGSFSIGPLEFVQPVADLGSCWVFGDFDTNPVVLDKTTGRVGVLVSHSVPDRLWTAAESVAELFDALAEVARFFSRRVVEPDLYDDLVATRECVVRAAERSGSMENETFYRMFFGI